MFDFDYKKPVVCAAIHNGHKLSDFVKENIAISENNRLREEDPFTDFFLRNCGNTIVPQISRFEVDLNRSKPNSIYLKPEDAWGLDVRKSDFTDEELKKLQGYYINFYNSVESYLRKLLKIHKNIFIFDIHSYNHHRKGNYAEYEDPKKNPEINFGTNIIHDKWFPLVEKIQQKITNYDFFGRNLDARTNIKFTGGNFSRWISRKFPENACCIAVEFKKIFIDEWSGLRDIHTQEKLRSAFESSFEEVYKFIDIL